MSRTRSCSVLSEVVPSIYIPCFPSTRSDRTLALQASYGLAPCSLAGRGIGVFLTNGASATLVQHLCWHPLDYGYKTWYLQIWHLQAGCAGHALLQQFKLQGYASVELPVTDAFELACALECCKVSSDPTYQWLWGSALVSDQEKFWAIYRGSKVNDPEVSPKVTTVCQQVGHTASALSCHLREIGQLLA